MAHTSANILRVRRIITDRLGANVIEEELPTQATDTFTLQQRVTRLEPRLLQRLSLFNVGITTGNGGQITVEVRRAVKSTA